LACSRSPPLEVVRTLFAWERKKNPLASPKVGSKVAIEIWLISWPRNGAIEAETLLAMAGVLVGQSLQASHWEEARKTEALHLVGEPIHRRRMAGLGLPWMQTWMPLVHPSLKPIVQAEFRQRLAGNGTSNPPKTPWKQGPWDRGKKDEWMC
jgi:hypothetical protein